MHADSGFMLRAIKSWQGRSERINHRLSAQIDYKIDWHVLVMSQPVDDDLISETEAAGQSGSQEWRGIVRRKFQQLQKGRNSGSVDRLTDRRYGGVSGTRLNQA